MPVAHAADGDLDDTMTGWAWENGIRIHPTSQKTDGAYDVMVDAAGTWTIGGFWSNANDSHTAHSWYLKQYGVTGGAPNVFSGDRKDRLFWSPKGDHIRETLPMADGRYAMIGYAGTNTTGSGSDFDCVIAVRQSDGDLDTTGFNSSGTKAATVTMGTNAAKGRMWVAFSTSKDDKCISGDIASDGKILVCGHVKTNSEGENVGIARVTTTGALDDTFSGDGRVTVDWNGDDICRALRIQADGKIIIGGTTNNQGSSGDAFVARYNTDGTIDTSFSTDGIHTFDTGDNHRDLLMDLQIQSDGKIVAGGYIDSPRDGWVARLNTDGTMDTSFGGGDGVLTTQFGTNDHIQALAIAGDGKILAGGWTDGSGTNDDFLVARFTTTGAIDTAFGGGDGFSSVDLGQHSQGTAGNDDKAYGIEISPVTGSVMLAGQHTKSGNNKQFAMAIFLNSTGPAAGYTVSETARTVSETGTTQTFTVVLDSQPTGDVVFDVSASDTGEATVSASTLTFTNGNWNTPQTVTVTGIDDSIDDGDQNSTVTVAVNAGSTADNNFDSLASSQVTVTTTDNDTSGVATSVASITVSEAGTTGTFTVVLDSQPTGNVVFDITATTPVKRRFLQRS